MRRTLQNIGHVAVLMLAAGFYAAVLCIPRCGHRPASRLAGGLLFRFMRGSRKRVLANLETAFGRRLPTHEKNRIVRELFADIVRNFIEAAYVTRIPARTLSALFDIEGEEHLALAVRQGKGVVGVCAHLGNFPVMQAFLVTRGYPINIIVRETNNRYLVRLFVFMKNLRGVPSLYKWDIRRTIRKSLDWLTGGGVLCLYVDQHAGNGVPVRFFGHQVRVPVGAAVFARKYRCPAVGIFTYRLPSGRHRVIIEGPYPLERTADVSADIRENCRLFMERVEAHVRDHPEQWFSWLHRRFR